MKKIATKFVLVAASTFIMGSVMAQTDTTKTPEPDTTQTPAPVPEPVEPSEPEEPKEPTDTTTTPTPPITMQSQTSSSIAAQVGQFNTTFYALSNRELLSSKQYSIKTEDENEA